MSEEKKQCKWIPNKEHNWFWDTTCGHKHVAMPKGKKVKKPCPYCGGQIVMKK